ncbi:hypothetical protein [Lyngbya sp. PCC 8106]|jgi:hypothetical protein|uniref:hypothetical protein n=1 Tax=Lyngbya sp. (strain PCC 8106) TaxID=313612 RepID=UPI0000EAC82D|nr:hypothetical protein [Lyngbya sp. PCC 8106]EAW38717.1 hypothetical protein L8106_14920 [Lyngbya sp. PCC 8106]
MKIRRQQLHNLVDQMPKDELERAWELLTTLYYDAYMLKAIQYAQRTLKPGDSFTTEEAMRVLSNDYMMKL